MLSKAAQEKRGNPHSFILDHSQYCELNGVDKGIKLESQRTLLPVRK